MIINGTDLLLYYSTDDGSTWTPLGYATSHSLSYNMTTRDVSHKKSGTAKKSEAGKTSMTGSAEGLVTYVADCDYHMLQGFITARTPLKIASAQDDGSGDPDEDNLITSDIYLTNVDITAGEEENTVYSISFEGNDDVTHTAAGIAPVYASSEVGTVADNSLIITYNSSLDEASIPATTDFSVNDGAANAVTNVAVSGALVTLTLTNDVDFGDTVIVSYTKGSNPLQSSSGDDCVDLTAESVTNNVSEAATWSEEMLASYVSINSQATYTTAQQAAILDRLEEAYVITTFGTAGLNKTVCDFFIFMEAQTAAMGSSTITKSGATLRWNYGDSNIYSANTLPTQITDGYVSVTSTDGFSGVTRMSLPSADFKGWIFNVPYYLTNCETFGLAGTTLVGSEYRMTGDITNWTLPTVSGLAWSIYEHDITGDISGWTFPAGMEDLDLSGNLLTGVIPNMPAMFASSTCNTQLDDNQFTGHNITTFNPSTNLILDFSSNYFTQSEIAELISNAVTYYTANAPAGNLTLTLDGVYMSSIPDGETDTDVVALKALFTTEGHVCTITYNDVDYLLTPIATPSVIITTDDAFLTDKTKVLPMMQGFSASFTAYIYDEILASPHSQQTDLDDLDTAGVDLAAHITNVTGVTVAEVEAVMDSFQAYWTASGWTMFTNCSYSGGAYDANTLLGVASYVETARGIGNVEGTFNTTNRGNLVYKDSNLLHLQSNSLDNANTYAENVAYGKAQIDRAVIKNAAVIFYVHQVDDTDIAMISEILTYAVAEGCDLLNMKELYAALTA